MRRSLHLALAGSLLVATAAWAQTAEEAVDLPSAADVFTRYVEAVGGAKALQAKTAMTSTGSFELVGMGVTGTVASYRAAPDLQYDRIEIEGLGLQEQGFDGEVAWERSTMLGPAILEGERGDLARLDAEFWPEMHYERLYDGVSTEGRTDFAGEACQEVVASIEGGHQRHLFFAVESGLLRGMRENRPTEMGDVDVEMRLDDYQAFDDVLVPTVMETTVLGQTQRFQIEAVSFEPIDPSRFALPDDVKVLLEDDDS
jgi:hypothetical protein